VNSIDHSCQSDIRLSMRAKSYENQSNCTIDSSEWTPLSICCFTIKLEKTATVSFPLPLVLLLPFSLPFNSLSLSNKTKNNVNCQIDKSYLSDGDLMTGKRNSTKMNDLKIIDVHAQLEQQLNPLEARTIYINPTIMK